MANVAPYILVVTSDEPFGRSVHSHLTRNGYQVKMVSDVVQAGRTAESIPPLLVLVDRRTKGIGGMPKHGRFRNLILLAVEPPGGSCDPDQCVKELENGFDFVICGETYRQLVARIRSVLRRNQRDAHRRRRQVVGPVTIDLDRYEVTVHGESIELTPTQYKILEVLMFQPMRALTRNDILEKVWGEGIAIQDHTLDVHIHALRKKIERDASAPVLLQTIRGVGYRMTPPDQGTRQTPDLALEVAKEA